MIWQNLPQYSQINYVKPIDLRDYLRLKGWTQEEFKRADILKFKSPSPYNDEGEFVEILVPLNEELIDYTKLVELAVENISSFEDRNIHEVLSQILNFADCIKSKIIEAKKGMIPLNQGVLLYENLLDLITFSASSEFERFPVKKFPRKLDRAISFAENSLMGQSELGSYVANIYIPLKRPNSDFSWDITSTFPRKVVLRILRGLKNLKDSVDDGNSRPIVDNYSTGLNSNMCSALMNIIDAGMGNDVIIDAVLEPAMATPAGVFTKFILKPNAKRYLKAAIEDFSSDVPEEDERVFFGYVSLLRRPEGFESGMIKLASIDEENLKTRNIKIELSPSEYEKAVSAHRTKKNIRIKGVLEKVGRFWFLRNPNDLEILEDDSEVPWKTLDKY